MGERQRYPTPIPTPPTRTTTKPGLSVSSTRKNMNIAHAHEQNLLRLSKHIIIPLRLRCRYIQIYLTSSCTSLIRTSFLFSQFDFDCLFFCCSKGRGHEHLEIGTMRDREDLEERLKVKT